MTTRPGAIAAGILVGLALAGSAIALAGEAPPINTEAAPAPVATEPVEDLAPPAWAPPGTIRGRAEAVAHPEHHDPAQEADFTVEDVPGQAIVNACRGPNPPTTRLHCRAVIAIAEGRMPPGVYSDHQLRERLGE
jgi:hypothetical protein